ncbi:D-arabinono-1,4-lactone oxidase [Acanthopleuribacter pedis]|uniref:FAD-binding protein n=1 Tax=Acanthopleuribacter pedis TaxID=442870 RepID=A0A8J7Q3V8_9BACT|nr:D-arabinono-1,4-lactone oxidase [Acanthopleuribacter pedis]MBO1317859.1 FAD-binding protein [Acanthopleuribacter pedis]
MKETEHQPWRNWSGYVRCTPQRTVHIEQEKQLADLIAARSEQGGPLRVVGSGHSFTPLVQTEDTLVNLDGFQGLIHMDEGKGTAEVWAGTKLHALGEMLHEHGRAQENLGDINVQSIAGAISTGTHGTGHAFPGIANQVIGLTFIDGRGRTWECDTFHNPELFNAARVSLGSFGMISRVKLQTVPAYKLHYRSARASLDDCMGDLDSHIHNNRNFEFYWFPYSDRVQLKQMNETEAEPSNIGWGKKFNDVVLENYAFWFLSETCRWLPRLCAPVSKLCAAMVGADERVDWSHRLYATPRLVRFQEMEYNVPRECFPDVVAEIRKLTAERKFRVHFPLECRFAAPDNIWLSPGYQRETAYIAVHMYRNMPWQEYFHAIEKIFLKYEGRPHWGKWHSLTGKQLAERYPKWSEFQGFRKELDPNGLFLNPHLRRLMDL